MRDRKAIQLLLTRAQLRDGRFMRRCKAAFRETLGINKADKDSLRFERFKFDNWTRGIRATWEA